jgi:hypothetical protein
MKRLSSDSENIKVDVIVTGALTSPDTNPHFADITYKLQVGK